MAAILILCFNGQLACGARAYKQRIQDPVWVAMHIRQLHISSHVLSGPLQEDKNNGKF